MPKQIAKTEDLATVRKYSYKGVDVLVSINRVSGTASLVEAVPYPAGYRPKKWDFSGRTLPYLRQWLVVLDAMKHAIEGAIEDLEAVEDAKLKETAEMVMALNDDIAKEDKKLRFKK